MAFEVTSILLVLGVMVMVIFYLFTKKIGLHLISAIIIFFLLLQLDIPATILITIFVVMLYISYVFITQRGRSNASA